MKEYLRILRNVLENGVPKHPVRVEADGSVRKLDNSTIGTFCEVFRHDMKSGFPLLSTKKMGIKNIATELEFFIKGLTDKRWLQERGCHIWDPWCNPQQIPQVVTGIDKDEKEIWEDISGEEKRQWQLENPDLGPVYGRQWRTFGGDYKPIPFIWTELDKSIICEPAKEDTDNLIGTTVEGKYGPYVIYKYCGIQKHGSGKLYGVWFNSTGFKKHHMQSTDVKKGHILDAYYPGVCEVACPGDYRHHESTLGKDIVYKLQNSWRNMIHRCYSKKHHAYKDYGGQNVYVQNRWLIFDNFLYDIQNLEGWQNKLQQWEKYQLDKDILGYNYYGAESCLWASRSVNHTYIKGNYYFDAIAPDGKRYSNEIGLKRFCNKHGMCHNIVRNSIKRNHLTYKGWKFIKKGQFKKPVRQGCDQLKSIVNKLKHNPYDRRMVCSVMNPNQLDIMALPPCHYAFNCVVYGNKLNLVFMMRSCDIPIGTPYNIASYALLLLLLAKESHLEPGELVGILADSHVYNNQIDAAKEQLTREPRPLPTIEITNEPFNIFEWTHKDVRISNYNPHPKLDFGAVTV